MGNKNTGYGSQLCQWLYGGAFLGHGQQDALEWLCKTIFTIFFFSSAASGPKGQWLPRQFSGCSKQQVNTANGRGMENYFPFSEALLPVQSEGKRQCVPTPGHSEAEVPQAQTTMEPFYQRLRQRMSWWRMHCQNPEVLELISQGVTSQNHLPSKLSLQKCFRNAKEKELALQTLQEYMEVHAVKEIHAWEAKHLIPWFVIQKGEKLRLITDCREINAFLNPKPFKLENWPEIFPSLRKGMWAAKIDLKHAYFHMGIADHLKQYICINIGEHFFTFRQHVLA